MLICRHLRKQFGARVAVNDVSFEVSDGECYGLLGPNGAGKTTTIAMVCGLLEPDDGDISVGGMPAGSMGARSAVGYVPQDIALYPDLTARENLRFFGRLYALSGSALDRRIDDVLGLVGLSARADDRIGSYSGGMKRRANIAAGLLHDPRLLILDEPTVGVDPQSRNAILETVSSLGVAVLYTTHYMEEAARLCRRVGIIDAGRLIAEGTPAGLVTAHGGPERVRLQIDPPGADGPAGTSGTLCVPPPSFVKACAHLDGVTAARVDGRGIELSAVGGAALLPRLVQEAERHAVRLTNLEVLTPDLESVFLALTGKELRD